MRRENVLTLGELEQHAQHIPEIDPSAVMAMLDVIQASAEIQHAIFDILEQEYQLSEGKLCAMIILHQQPDGMAPSKLAARAGVTRATISVMLRRMERDGLVRLAEDAEDARSKRVSLTSAGSRLMDEILPAHYLSISKLMGRLDKNEQAELSRLLKKVTAG